MKKKLLILLSIILIVWIFVVNDSDRKYAFDYPVEEEIHYHAGFLIYKDGQLQDYSSPEYMKVSPCGIDMHDPDIELTAQQEQLEKAHLHDGNGDVVHVHRENATWGDFFVNAGINISEDAYAYQRDVKTESIFDLGIEPNDSLVIIDGVEPQNIEEILENKVSMERIEEVESISESCSN